MPEQFSNITDQQLLERFYKDRNNHWLGILFERYTLLLYGLCLKYLKNEEEARDAVQQVFLKSIAELHRYRVQFFKSWLYMVAKNHCLMLLRERGRSVSGLDETMIVESPTPSMEDLQEKDHQLELMMEGLRQLNQEQQQCVTLFYLQKKSYQQIAEQTGYSLMQVKSFIQNGKRNLRLIMEKNQKRKP